MYEGIKALHICLALASVASFVARWIARRRGIAWARARWVRIAPHILDTCLLASAVTLATHWEASVLLGWLGAKMLALLGYIVLAAIALRRLDRPGGTPALAGALLAALWIVSIAIFKSAWGPLTPVLN